MKIAWTLCILFTLLSLLFIRVDCQHTEPSIDILQLLENQVIEENEKITLPLNDYFRGQYLNYQIIFPKIMDKKQNETELSQLIYVSPSHSEEESEYISNVSYQNIGVEPFSSSSILMISIPEYSKRQIKMFMVTRDLKFIEFLVYGNGINDKQLIKVNEIQLDSSLQYSKCRDLTYIKDKETKPSSQNFILFCKGIRNQNENYYTTVLIKRLYWGKMSAAYFLFPEEKMPVIPDFNKTSEGLRYLKEVDDFQSPVKYFSTRGTDRVNGTNLQLIMGLDIRILRYIAPGSKIEGNPILKPFKYIRVARVESFSDRIVHDLILIKYDYINDKAYFAFSVVETGLMICGMNITDFENASLPILFMYDYKCQELKGTASSYLFKPDFTQGLDTYDDINDFTDEQGLYIYGVRIQPPEVVEYDIRDINNVQMFKKYLLMSRLEDRKIGTRYIAVNKNYLIHLVYEPETLTQYLRVFNRHAAFKVSAKFEIPIEIDSPMNFFAFPNFIYDCVVVRDERQVKLLSIMEQALIIDSTQSKIDIVKKYQGGNNSTPIYLYVTSQNTMEVPLSRINVTFLEKNNIEIFPIDEKNMNSKIFYNCGSNTFRYVVSSYYNGPNYNLDVQQSNFSNNLFIFENQHMNLTFESGFNFSNCRLNFVFPQSILKQAADFMQGGDIDYEQDHEDELSKRNKTTILVCVDFKNQMLRSYDLMTLYTNQSTIYEISRATNQIWMPEFTYFVDFQQDIQERTILGIVENKYDEKIIEGETDKFTKYELHYFEVQNQILWKSRQPFPNLKNISLFTYNHLLNLGLVIEFQESAFIYPMIDPGPLEIYYSFELDKLNKNIVPLNTWYNLNMTMSDRTIKSVHASEYVILTLTVERKLRVYQKWKNQQIGMQLIQEFEFLDPATNKSDLRSFDIFDNRFFVVYRATNIMEVYTIENYVQFTYKMTLPLYEEYEDYQFYINDSDERFPDLPHIVRTYLDNFMAILMTNPATNDTQLLIYGLDISQHNAFVLNQSLTDFYGKFQKTTYSNLIFTGQDRSQSIIGVMNDYKIKLYQAQYYNQLIMSPEISARKELIEQCKNVKNSNPIYQGLDDDKVMKDIDSIIVRPTSLFKQRSSGISVIDKKVNITIKSKNQGMAVTLKTEMDRVVNISYSDDVKNIGDDFSPNLIEILHETYLEGQGLKFNTLCEYKTNTGKTENCTQQVVDEQSADLIYNFSIEYTTGNAKIFKYFTLGKLFFMFDNNFKMNVLRFPIYQQDLKTVSGFPLRRINEERQDKLFGCNITGFSDYYNMTENSSSPNETYLFMYHCKNASDAQWQLNAAVITSYNDAFNQDDLDAQAGFSPIRTLYSVRIFPAQSVQVPYQIIDLDKINIPSKEENIYIFHIAFTCEIPDSETNLLKFYELRLNLSENGKIVFKGNEPTAVSGYNYQRNSFKVTKIEPIKESRLIFVVSEEYGFYIFNMSSMFSYDPIDKYLIGELNVYEMINFKEQIATSLLKQFRIISFTLHMPTQVICVTTYGIMIIEYPVDLRNTSQILKNYPKSLIPKSKRHIQGYYNEYSKMIVQNAYGNAFLVKTLISGDSLYQTQLLGMSFFSSSNSLVFKLLSIPAGIGPSDQCSELNPSHYFELTPEDQLAVSFICNQYLYVYRMCMRPHVELNMSNMVVNSSSGLSSNPGIFQFNEFKITLQAWNDKSGSQGLNRENVTLNLQFGEKPSNYKATIYNALILIAISIILVVLSYLENALCRVQKDLKKQQKEHLNRYSTMIIAQKQKREKTQQIANYRLNHTTIESSNSFLTTITVNGHEQKQEENFDEQANKSPRFNTFRKLLSNVDDKNIRQSKKQTINNSVLTDSMSSDL